MHELPKDLTHSLRSWRGSIYGNHSVKISAQNEPGDLEKGPEDYGEKDFERALSPADSSIILHPTASRHGLDQAARQKGQQHGLHHIASQDDFHLNTQTSTKQQGKLNTSAKRQTNVPPQTPASANKSVFTAPPIDDPDSAADRLDDDTTPLTPANFYELMGMREPISKLENPKDLAIRHGLYSRIQKRLSYIQTKYRIFDVATYVLLILQLLLSAVFIVLGSLRKVDSHIAIAVLGALSAVIGGVLALMKGQGLPNRLRQTRDALRNVVFEAEELYWDVGADKPVLYEDVKKVREDFLRVLEEGRRNHPDTWNSISSDIARGVTTQGNGKKAVIAPATATKA